MEVYLYQREVLVKSGRCHKEVAIEDEYDISSIYFEDLGLGEGKFIEDEMELLTIVFKASNNNMGLPDKFIGILDFVYETQNGISIDGTYYDYEEIEPYFKKYYMDEGDTA